MIDSITFITGNLKKVREIQTYFPISLTHKKIELTEIQSLNLNEIVEHKAKEAYRIVRSPVLIEDVSLAFSALGGKLPGTFIKWFLEELGTEGLCQMLDGYKNRHAIVTVMYGLYDGKTLKTFSGSVNGAISDKPLIGEWDFGFNTIFIPKGFKKSWSQMDERGQHQTSMRRIALEKLEAYLKTI